MDQSNTAVISLVWS